MKHKFERNVGEIRPRFSFKKPSSWFFLPVGRQCEHRFCLQWIVFSLKKCWAFYCVDWNFELLYVGRHFTCLDKIKFKKKSFSDESAFFWFIALLFSQLSSVKGVYDYKLYYFEPLKGERGTILYLISTNQDSTIRLKIFLKNCIIIFCPTLGANVYRMFDIVAIYNSILYQGIL